MWRIGNNNSFILILWHFQLSLVSCLPLVTYFFDFSWWLRQHFIQFTSMAGLPRFTHTFLKIIWFASIWVLWKEMNNRVFQNMVSHPSVIIEQVKLNSFLCWNQNRWPLFIVIMIGGKIPFFVWVSTCNLCCFVGASLIRTPWSCKYSLVVCPLHTLCRVNHCC